MSMNDKITLRDALEYPIWLMIYAGEPNRKIDVTMSYVELKAIYDMVNAKKRRSFKCSVKYITTEV